MKLLTEKTREVGVTATAMRDSFIYNVEYKISNGSVTRVTCNVHQKVKEAEHETERHLGYMANESGNQQYVFPETASIAPHVIMFEEIVKEIKEDEAQ